VVGCKREGLSPSLNTEIFKSLMKDKIMKKRFIDKYPSGELSSGLL
jgi:hypothetical protein